MMHILLIEDSRLLRESIMEMLMDCNNLTVDDFATTKQGAISLLNTKQYDLMIADIELQEGTGFDVVKHTRSTDYAFKPPITMMLTNHTNNYFKRLAHQLEVKYFFDKSMDFEKAIQTIQDEANNFAH